MAGVETEDPTNGNAGTHARDAAVEASHRNARNAWRKTQENADEYVADETHAWKRKWHEKKVVPGRLTCPQDASNAPFRRLFSQS